MEKLRTWLRNLPTRIEQVMMRYLQKRDWVVFYLEPKYRKCCEGDGCWLGLYESLRHS